MALAISPDGRWLATGGADASASVWDLEAKEPARTRLALRGHTDTVWGVALSPDSRWLVTASQSLALLWDLHARNPAASPTPLPGHTAVINCVRFSSDSRRLTTGGQDQTARVWDLAERRPASPSTTVAGLSAAVREVGFGRNGQWLALGGLASTPLWWDLKSGKPAAATSAFSRSEHNTFVTDKHWLVSWQAASTPALPREVADQSVSNYTRLWDVTSDHPLQRRIMLPVSGDVSLTADGRWLLARKEERRKPDCLVDLKSAQPFAQRIDLPAGWLRSEFSSDGRWLVTPGSAPNTARLWKLDRFPKDPSELRGHADRLASAAFSADSRHLATLSSDAVHVWDLSAADPAKAPRTIRLRESKPAATVPDGGFRRADDWPPTGSVALGHDGRWLVVLDGRGPVRVWDLKADGKEDASRALPGTVRFTLSPRGRWLVTGDGKGDQRLWDLSSFPAEQPALHLGAGIFLVSDDERRLALVRWQPGPISDLRFPVKVELWDSAAGKAPITGGSLSAFGQLPRPVPREIIQVTFQDYQRAVALTPDGRWLATRDSSGAAQLHDLSKPSLDQPLKVPGDSPVYAFAFSRRGNALVVSTLDGRLQPWRLTPKGVVRDRNVFPGIVVGLPKYSPDGRWLISHHILAQLDAEHPGKGYRQQLAASLAEVGELHLKQSRANHLTPPVWKTELAAAEEAFTRAMALAGTLPAGPRQEAVRKRLGWKCKRGQAVVSARRGQQEKQSGRPAEAARAFARSLDLLAQFERDGGDLKNADVLLHQALASAGLGKWQQAISSLTRGAALAPQEKALSLGAYILHSRMNHHEQAQAALRKVLPAEVTGPRPTNRSPPPWWAGGARHLGLSRSYWGEIAFLADLAGSETDGWFWHAKGLASAAQGDWGAALNRFREGVQRQPNEWRNHWGLALASAVQNDWQEVVRSCSVALRIQEQQDEIRQAASAVGVLVQPCFPAPVSMLVAKAAPTGDWHAWYLRGIGHQQAKRFSECEADLSEALRRGAAGWGTWAQRGYAHQRLGNWEKARDDYTAFLRTNPSHEWTLVNRGSIYAEPLLGGAGPTPSCSSTAAGTRRGLGWANARPGSGIRGYGPRPDSREETMTSLLDTKRVDILMALAQAVG
jgi:WD40 repeat protein/tetratricopeptide (TPR) repeat protein